MKQIEFRAMGCQMMAALDSSSRRGVELLEQVPAWFEAWEQCLSRFRPDSELSRLNARAGQAVAVSLTLWEVFQAAHRAEAASNGLVTPVVLEALVGCGYDRSFEQLGQSTASSQPRSSATVGQLGMIIVDPVRHVLQLPAGMHLDFGGIAKGWAAEQALKRLQPYGPALVDAGGDIAVSGVKRDGTAWAVAVDDPLQPGSDLEILLVGRRGIATSGTDFRRWQQNGQWRHHIIDPRTGEPAETDLLSVTIVAAELTSAETAAKYVLILGSQEGLFWLERQPACAGLLVTADGRRLYSSGIQTYLWREKCL